MTIEEIYAESIRTLAPSERFRLATLILSEIPPQSDLDIRDEWAEEDMRGISAHSARLFAAEFPGEDDLVETSDVVVLDFPGVTDMNLRPAVVVSSDAYPSSRPDVILGVLTSQVAGQNGATDHAPADWSAAGLQLPSMFRSFLVTVLRTAVYHVAGHLSDQDWLAVRAKLGTALRRVGKYFDILKIRDGKFQEAISQVDGEL